MELVKANTELRHKQSDTENLVQNLKDKVSEQKKRIEYLNRSKKDMEENSDRIKVKKPSQVLENVEGNLSQEVMYTWMSNTKNWLVDFIADARGDWGTRKVTRWVYP